MSHVNLERRALCSLEDIKAIVPGFDFDEQLTDALVELANGISDDAHDETGREFVRVDDTEDPAARLFDLSGWNVRERRVRIGDCASVTTVKVVELDGTVLETVDAANRVLLPRLRADADPIRQVWLPAQGVASPASTLACGRALEVTAVWGFPEIPTRLRKAIAKLVLVRYASGDVTTAELDTDFSQALDNLNLPMLFRSATATIGRFALPAVA